MRSAMVILSVAILSFPAAATATAQDPPIQRGDEVVIQGKSANLMMGPRVVATLPGGSKVRVSEVEGQWLGVYAEGKGGWLRRSQVAPLSATPAPLPVLGSPLRIDPAGVKGEWLVANGSMRVVDQEYFSETDGLAIVRITRNPGNRLVLATFDLQATAAEPAAIDRLARTRDLSQNRHRTLQKEIKLPCRYFDMKDFVLVDAAGKSYGPRWNVDKAAKNEYQAPENQLIVGLAPDPPHFHHTQRRYKEFDGLLEVGPKVSVTLLYRVPESVPLDQLQLQPHPSTPAAVKPGSP